MFVASSAMPRAAREPARVSVSQSCSSAAALLRACCRPSFRERERRHPSSRSGPMHAEPVPFTRSGEWWRTTQLPVLELPARIPRDRLADACREAAAEHSVEPATAEKDYYLTRLITALAEELGESALLKGGTLLSKVDIGFNRMSEDVDLVLPGTPDTRKRSNAKRMDLLRNALVRVHEVVGVEVPLPHGERADRDSHVLWEVRYESEFGPQRIFVEATMRPVLRPARRVRL
ncbi:MAG: hypothetical protein EHM50_04970, partial [Lysobacterales bacterium]